MIKLQDFARECGVTDRAIQKHLKKHEKSLEGHFHRRGPNGTWLDETAQNYIRSLMKEAPVVISDTQQYQKIEKLQEEINVLKDKLLAASELIINQKDMLEAAAQTKLLLEASEKEKKILEGFIQDAKTEIETLKQEADQERKKAVQELREEQIKRNTLEDEKKVLEDKIEVLENRNWLQRLFRKDEQK